MVPLLVRYPRRSLSTDGVLRRCVVRVALQTDVQGFLVSTDVGRFQNVMPAGNEKAAWDWTGRRYSLRIT